jgi:hypothetical protein
MESIPAFGGAAAKIIGQPRTPTGAETDAPPGCPLCWVEEISRAVKIT